ncbi:adenosylcobinamide-phosphate synthase CbiB [Carboxylicivirga sp. M1479]|uniref:adenosylcobinamide-phosphate synthase CbiB n=1 Tax=Carboxylicivirga sp. M1479 TaxID=2594476 RepID=UPI00117877A8|nr:adenosylcobinamide-phosphate synthase CbiB [Carboxylicivirga sp. M1479]TRX66467.1 cobalamin biosynthesis protein CobD [Carboxylicivirga sp. M1479]
MEEHVIGLIIAVFIAYILDLLVGDPISLPHPIVYFGRMITCSNNQFNYGRWRLIKGALVSLILIGFVFVFFQVLMHYSLLHSVALYSLLTGLFFFYGLANRTLIREGVAVFKVLNNDGLEAGRKQLARIVGRDTSQLTEQQIKKASLETMAENLSDGVVAPIFWFALLGIPGMMAYKMINTLDSMIGYKNEQYFLFGKIAAYIDDIANYIPARITALLMVVLGGSINGFRFVFKYGHKHSSPNAGFPEAALAGILNVRFGGPNTYHGQVLNKPFIGNSDREIILNDAQKTARINHLVTLVSVLLCIAIKWITLT